jgi:hypothetical protein
MIPTGDFGANLTFAVGVGFRGVTSRKPFACNAGFRKTAE